jgi:uncharacterized membrane protein YgcG|tara:strand:- start:165 stop:662 length:498 start_codon:yes stop_codon:yes gene_type:complete
MGFATGNTNSFNVYLTPMARKRLYTGVGGDISFKYFSLHDSDINYTKSATTAVLSGTPAGLYNKVPDLRGETQTIGINGCAVEQLEDFVIRNNGELTPCPAGLNRNVNGDCVELRYLRQRTREITRKKINNNFTTTNTQRTTSSTNTNTQGGGSSSSGGGSGGGY